MSTVTKFIPGVPGAPGRHELASEKVKIGEKQALTPEGWIAIGTEGALTLFFIGTFLLLIWKWILDSGNKKHQ
ncbi:MAG: hypothetical protein P4L95_03565 [Rouxiella aceris]|uniref:hypothetical protein n=1 Tax=Rouxiella aceris TaxID=2703884 RepID=UPI002844E93D|nr:hypothetical protein [Rouxiella aceris]MDR3430978.1 hypothetical protein [Rouxiella aceris]